MITSKFAKWQFGMRASAPPPIGMALWSYAVMAVPATLAALFAWSLWLGAVLLVPGMALYTWSGWIAAAKMKITSRRTADNLLAIAIVVPGVILFTELVKGFPLHYRPLLFVGYVIVLVDPIRRMGWLWIHQRDNVMSELG